MIIGIRGNGSITDLVNLSQVYLCLVLPFAMFPLLQFTSSRKIMGQWRNGWFLLVLGWGSVLLITGDGYLQPAGGAQRSLARHHRQMRRTNEFESESHV